MQNPIIDANAAGFQQLGWTVAKWFLTILLIALVLGLVIGLFTYGRPPRRKSKSDGLFDEVADFGVELSHRIIDMLLNRHRSGGWLNDQQILAMLRGMNPYEFEDFIGEMFAKLGYKVEMNGGSGDGGIDINLFKNGRHSVVQCKKFITRKVTPHDVRDFYGAMVDRGVDGKGFFITTNIFTLDAENFAEGKQMELIDGARLIQHVRQSGVLGQGKELTSALADSRKTVTACPKCGSELVIRINKKDGTKFYGCSAYPKCVFTKPI